MLLFDFMPHKTMGNIRRTGQILDKKTPNNQNNHDKYKHFTTIIVEAKGNSREITECRAGPKVLPPIIHCYWRLPCNQVFKF